MQKTAECSTLTAIQGSAFLAARVTDRKKHYLLLEEDVDSELVDSEEVDELVDVLCVLEEPVGRAGGTVSELGCLALSPGVEVGWVVSRVWW